jgi:hypothetical protein
MFRLVKIDSKRSVLPFSMLIMLTHAVSLHIRPSSELNIHNQCLNIYLVHPLCVTDDELECRSPPLYGAPPGYTM